MWTSSPSICPTNFLTSQPGRSSTFVSREDQPFGQAIDDFVENLRKLTDECLDD
jgi:hypothetical protein